MNTGTNDRNARSISVSQLQAQLATQQSPIVIDVRRENAFREATQMISGALRRDPDAVASWRESLPAAGSFVVYCAHGGEVSRNVAKALAERDITVRYLEGGFAGWTAAGGAVDRKPRDAATRWVTRERPKIDRVACPWLISRFVDAGAEFMYVPTPDVLGTAKAEDAIPYDVPDVHFSHEGERCSFDAFIRHYRLHDPALHRLALIVRAADTAHLEMAAEAPGVAAISSGLSRNFPDDHEMLAYAIVMYDALYTWCKQGLDKRWTWTSDIHRSPRMAKA